jgi:hypothetical protein
MKLGLSEGGIRNGSMRTGAAKLFGSDRKTRMPENSKAIDKLLDYAECSRKGATFIVPCSLHAASCCRGEAILLCIPALVDDYLGLTRFCGHD